MADRPLPPRLAKVQPVPLPNTALLRRQGASQGYTDAYAVDLPAAVNLPGLIEAFYTTPLFKAERLLLSRLARKPSSDADAHALAGGQRSSFAAWTVEDRSADQILLVDFLGRTRSWLMVEAVSGPGLPVGTRLYFGSAVRPLKRPGQSQGRPSMGLAFHALLGFHRLYSRLLLASARARLLHQRGG